MAIADDLSSVQSALTCYILPFIFLFGIIGNVLNITVFSQKHLRMNSCSIYFISTSIFNFLVMCFGIIPILTSSYSSYDYASYSVSYCKLRSYFVHVLFMMSRSSVALACIDRFALCSPNVRIRALSQRGMAIKLISIVCFLWLLIPIHMIIFVDIQMSSRRCGGNGSYSYIYGLYAAVVTAIPLIIMLLFSSLAIYDLKRIRSRIQPDQIVIASNTPRTVRIKKRDAQLMIILVSEVAIYFCSTVLFPIYSIYVAATSNVSKNADRTAIECFIRYMALSFLLYLNSASIFYAHILASKAFCKECKQLMLRLIKRRENENMLMTTAGMSNTKGPISRIGKQQQQMDISLRNKVNKSSQMIIIQ